MKRAALATALAAVATLAIAGPDEVKLPADYQSGFVNYVNVDRPDRKRVRRMYVNPAAHAAAVAGQPLPDGTILIMEDHEAQLDGDGNPVYGADGRMIALPDRGNIFVMEKNAAWSTDNENWDYAWYVADGTPRPDANFEGCFSCHANRTERDYTFTYFKHLLDTVN